MTSFSSALQRERSDLARFAQEFSDESHLRAILHDLLLRTGAKRVRITHGPTERGKDIVFYKAGGLSADVLYACVVKKDRITGRADSNGGAQTVLNQALQALSEPYVDPVTGREDRPHSVYVMCPNECTQEAVASIKHQLREQARRVEFLCGIDLLELFQEHWPDFLRFESAVLTRFLSTLRAGLSVDNALIALLTRNNANLGLKPFEKFYVPNRLELRLDRLRAPGVKLLWPEAFGQYMTLDELYDTVARLRFWKQALRSAELTEDDPIALKEVAAHIDEFCKASKRYWDQALKTGRPRKPDSPKPGDKGKEPEERKLGVPYHVLHSYTKFVPLVDKVNQQLNKIDKASVAVRKSAKSLSEATAALLADPDFCFTSVGYDYLNATPGLVKQEQGKKLPVNPEVLFSGCRAALVTGPPGSGKTSFCRWHTLRAIERFSADWSQPLPVYVSAHRVAASPEAGFEEAFLGGIDVGDLWPTDQERLKVSVLLFLDGLDEVPDREQQQRIVEILRAGMQKYPRLVAIVTSRPYVWGAWLNWLPRLHMADLGLAEQRTLAERWLADSDQVQAFFDQLRCSPALQKLMGVPLLATLILNLYRQTPTIPENKASLYRAFVDLYCGGWDVAKGIHKPGRFPNEQKLRPLPGLAHRMHLSHKADCTEGLFIKVIEDTMPTLSSRAADLLGEIIQDGILVRVGHDLVFAHLSFQEYLAAQYLASDPKGRRPTHALNQFLRGEDWWKEILEFYIISRDDPATLDDWIMRASGGAGMREKKDDGEDRDNQEIIGRLDSLARVLSETFSGYLPRFNQRRTPRARSLS